MEEKEMERIGGSGRRREKGDERGLGWKRGRNRVGDEKRWREMDEEEERCDEKERVGNEKRWREMDEEEESLEEKELKRREDGKRRSWKGEKKGEKTEREGVEGRERRRGERGKKKWLCEMIRMSDENEESGRKEEWKRAGDKKSGRKWKMKRSGGRRKRMGRRDDKDVKNEGVKAVGEKIEEGRKERGYK